MNADKKVRIEFVVEDEYALQEYAEQYFMNYVDQCVDQEEDGTQYGSFSSSMLNIRLMIHHGMSPNELDVKSSGRVSFDVPSRTLYLPVRVSIPESGKEFLLELRRKPDKYRVAPKNSGREVWLG